MVRINKLLDGTERGQLKVRIFAFLYRLDTSRSMEPESLKECIVRVFRIECPEGIIQEWLRQR